jgi:hypothetical protein
MSETPSQYANPGGMEHTWEHNVLHNFQPPSTLVAQPPYIDDQKTIGLGHAQTQNIK